MSVVFFVKDAGGVEHGPFDRAGLAQCGEILDDPNAEIIEYEEELFQQIQLSSYLNSLLDSGTAYSQLPATVRQELEKHFYVLVRKGPQSWDETEMNNYRLIMSIPGRKDFYDEFGQYENTSVLRCIVQHLELLDSESSRVRELLEMMFVTMENHATALTHIAGSLQSSTNSIKHATSVSALRAIQEQAQ